MNARLLATLCVTLLGACRTMPSDRSDAAASIAPTQGNSVTGEAQFHQAAHDQIRVTVALSGLAPNSEHGFHIHEMGDCSSPDAMSAGGHFNPTAQPHGPPSGAHHAGDMPVLKADAHGNANVSFEFEGVSVVGAGDHDIVGRSVIVHAAPDDYKTQPTGNSGARLACGVIKRE